MKLTGLALLAILLIVCSGCDATAHPVERGSPIHRFEHVSNIGADGVALDTVTGQWCKTWNWVYKDDAKIGGLDTLPSCLKLYNENKSTH